MNTETPQPRDYRFVTGLLAGAFVGAGLAVWLAPRLAPGFRRLTDAARDLGQRASEQYQQASSRVGDAVDEMTRKGQDACDNVADAVARGAHEVERFAKATKAGAGDRL